MRNGLIIDDNGIKRWFKDDKLHREDGPAIEWENKNKFWYQNDQLHREDGPAFESADGSKYWYYHGKYIKCSSQQEFKRLIKLKLLW